MFSINDLKVGAKITFNGEPYVVIFSEHSKQGRAGAVMRTKIRNLISGAILEKTFAGAEKLESADLETKKAQYLYSESDLLNFMDSVSFEQFTLSKKQLGESAKFLKEGAEIDILYFRAEPINISLPIKMEFEITYTEPGFKGNTASTVSKPATIETGAQVMVPLFIKVGDKIVLDTRTGEYVERA